MRDIKATVERLGGVRRVAEMVGVHSRNVQRWVAGERDATEPVWRLLERIEAEQAEDAR